LWKCRGRRRRTIGPNLPRVVKWLRVVKMAVACQAENFSQPTFTCLFLPFINFHCSLFVVPLCPPSLSLSPFIHSPSQSLLYPFHHHMCRFVILESHLSNGANKKKEVCVSSFFLLLIRLFLRLGNLLSPPLQSKFGVISNPKETF
jgi:hypothetical protein